MNEILNEYVAACEDEYARKTGRRAQAVGFDPISIFTIILSIITQMCPKPPAQLAKEAKDGTLAARVAVQSATRQALREKHPGVFLPYRKFDGDAIAASVLAVAASAGEEKVAAAMACCAA